MPPKNRVAKNLSETSICHRFVDNPPFLQLLQKDGQKLSHIPEEEPLGRNLRAAGRLTRRQALASGTAGTPADEGAHRLLLETSRQCV
jgi:hypothetical protein